MLPHNYDKTVTLSWLILNYLLLSFMCFIVCSKQNHHILLLYFIALDKTIIYFRTGEHDVFMMKDHTSFECRICLWMTARQLSQHRPHPWSSSTFWKVFEFWQTLSLNTAVGYTITRLRARNRRGRITSPQCLATRWEGQSTAVNTHTLSSQRWCLVWLRILSPYRYSW